MNVIAVMSLVLAVASTDMQELNEETVSENTINVTPLMMKTKKVVHKEKLKDKISMKIKKHDKSKKKKLKQKVMLEGLMKDKETLNASGISNITMLQKKKNKPEKKKKKKKHVFDDRGFTIGLVNGDTTVTNGTCRGSDMPEVRDSSRAMSLEQYKSKCIPKSVIVRDGSKVNIPLALLLDYYEDSIEEEEEKEDPLSILHTFSVSSKSDEKKKMARLWKSSISIHEPFVNLSDDETVDTSICKLNASSHHKLPVASPHKLPDASPHKLDDASPHKLPDASPHKLPDASPHKLSDASPHKLPDASPHKLPDASPHKLSDASPHKLPDASPHKLPDASPHKLPDASPHKLPDASPHKLPTSPHKRPLFPPHEVPNVVHGSVWIPSLNFLSLSNGKMALVVKHPGCVFLRGKLKVSVLLGEIECLGCLLRKENTSEGIVVYSTERANLLCLETCAFELREEDKEHAINTLQELGLDGNETEVVLSDIKSGDCLLIAEKVTEPLLECFYLYSPVSLFPKISSGIDRQFQKAENMLQCQFEFEETMSPSCLFHKGFEWETIAETAIELDCKLIVCGGKDVGKSTFLRYLINYSLRTFQKVLYLDFDVGQTEFTVPGCVSATLICEPLLGPNFTHPGIKPSRMIYLGEVDVTKCASRYLKCVNEIIEYCNSQDDLKRIPWFCNTMGFNKGIGVELMVNIIRFLKPSHLIQINSRSPRLNFKDTLNAEWASEYQSSWTLKSAEVEKPLEYVTITINTATAVAEKKVPAWNYTPGGLVPRDSREIMTVAYFSSIIKPPLYSLLHVPTHKTPLENLKVSFINENINYDDILNALNGSFVGLCSTEEEAVVRFTDLDMPLVLIEPPVCNFIGFGIVRCIDLRERVMYLITPISEHELSQVNCLVVGAITPPSCFFRCVVSSVSRQIPFTVTGSGHPTSNLIRHLFVPPNHAQSKNITVNRI